MQQRTFVDRRSVARTRQWPPGNCGPEAIFEQHPDIVQFLLSRGANVHGTNPRARPLIIACMVDNLVFVRQLLAADADPDACDESQHTALHHAAGEQGSNEVARELIEMHNANMLAVDKDGLFPLIVPPYVTTNATKIFVTAYFSCTETKQHNIMVVLLFM